MTHICNCIPARIQQALANLPETLDETYQRSLREINKDNLEFAHRLFQFVAVASRPLLVEELAQLLAFDFKAGSIPKFQEDWCLKDPVHAVLSTCSSLLAVVDGGYHSEKVIQFSHLSVKDYLTSNRLAEANDVILRGYHVSMTPAHTVVAKACLGILLHLDYDVVTCENLEKWPLARYAAEYWVHHALFDDVSRSAEDGMKQLFDPTKSHFAIWVWIHDPENFVWALNLRPMPPDGTPLHYAALWGLHSIVEFLIIEHSQDVHTRRSADNETPLHLASKRGHVKSVSLLIQHGADMSAQNQSGMTPLHLASREGQVEVTRMLIERGADVTAQNNDEETPLHLASSHGQLEVIDMLIEHGADVKAQRKHGETPLHQALLWGQVEVARMIIERGADVLAQNNDGDTPLHLTSSHGRLEATVVLFEHGADVAAQNKHGETPLHQASFWGQVEVARMLTDHGANVTAKNEDGLTSLHVASQEGQVEVILMLIECGADLMAQNKDGETPLHLASQEGQVEASRMLILYGADLAAQNQDGMTPLHLAAFHGQQEITFVLIECSADMTARNNYGLTPLELALQHGNGEVACLLVECGAGLMEE